MNLQLSIDNSQFAISQCGMNDSRAQSLLASKACVQSALVQRVGNTSLEVGSMFRLFLVLSVAFSLLLLGGPARAADPTANDLKEILLAYHNYFDKSKGAAPTKAADMAEFLQKGALSHLEDKSVVFIYGVTLREMVQGTSNTVLAYEKNVPTKGGWVGFGDGSVKRMSADEFKKAIVAKPKQK
jgi:hypothetical protein